MYKFFSKNGLTAALIVGFAISAITMIMLMSSDAEELDELVKYSSASNFGLFGVYFLVFGCTALAVVLPIMSMLNEPKKLMGAGIGIGLIAVIYLISWAMADSYAAPKLVEDFDLTESTSRMVGGALNTMYVLIVVAIVGAVYSEVSKAFK